jgi:hypothetical protein
VARKAEEDGKYEVDDDDPWGIDDADEAEG